MNQVIREGVRALAIVSRNFRLVYNRANIRPQHLIPDLGMLELGGQVLDQAHNAIVLFTLGQGHSAYPCIRAGFEASQDAVLLGTAPDYDFQGCRFRAADVLSRAASQRIAVDLDAHSGITYSDAELIQPDKIFEEEARRWDDLRSGMAELYWAAVRAVQQDRAKRIYSWYGVSRHRAAAVIHDRIAAPDVADRYRAFYSLLSLHSHPTFGGGLSTLAIQMTP